MERDNLISHGASAVIQERLFKSCDPFKQVYCKSCGTIAIANYVNKEYKCRGCNITLESCEGGSCSRTCNNVTENKDGNFGICDIPYSFKYLIQTLMGAGIKLGLGFDKPVTTEKRVGREKLEGETDVEVEESSILDEIYEDAENNDQQDEE